MTTLIRKWNGDKIVQKVKSAAAEAIDETTQAAADVAKESHWWSAETERLEEQTISERAIIKTFEVNGRFGTTERLGFYGLILERRSGFLRPAADSEFPKLAGRIAEKMD